MTVQVQESQSGLTSEQKALNKRLEDIGWGLFLIMIGALWLVPDNRVASGTWIIGAGIIMLAVNVMRRMSHIPINLLSTFLGILALLAGISSAAGVSLPLFPIVLVFCGALILLKPLFMNRPRQA
jgi:hypothetical protein